MPTSDAGQERIDLYLRRRDPDTYRFTCCECGLDMLRDGETVTCQGAVPDLCTLRMCGKCAKRCWSCGLPCCPDHRRKLLPVYSGAGGLMKTTDHECDSCAAIAAADAEEEAERRQELEAEMVEVLRPEWRCPPRE